MTASAYPHLQPDRLDATGVGDDADDRCLLDAVRDRLCQDRFRVLVAGEAKRGKSTLLNVLLDRRLCDRLARDLDTLRGTVPDLLGVFLVLPQDGGPLAANPRLHYQAHLAQEAADPVPTPVDLARSEIQQRLAESTRHMERGVAARYEAVSRSVPGR